MENQKISQLEKNFKVFGFSKDYYIGNKYMGCEILEVPDRELFGYQGRRKEISKKDLELKKNKKIKSGTEVTTELVILCGRVKS
jgi:hypothetical protein